MSKTCVKNTLLHVEYSLLDAYNGEFRSLPASLAADLANSSVSGLLSSAVVFFVLTQTTAGTAYTLDSTPLARHRPAGLRHLHVRRTQHPACFDCLKRILTADRRLNSAVHQTTVVAPNKATRRSCLLMYYLPPPLSSLYSCLSIVCCIPVYKHLLTEAPCRRFGCRYTTVTCGRPRRLAS